MGILFGTSENEILDEFIYKKRLKWIPYNQFKNVEYIDIGGFGIIYKAIWLQSSGEKEVALKYLNNLNESNLNENLDNFLNEWNCHEKCLESVCIIDLYGFTINPVTLNYMVVMDYANMGNLRGNLAKVIENNWNQRLFMLYKIIYGLKKIHEQNLIYCDLHDGNILNHKDEEDLNDKVFISDLGLCQPVKSFLKKYDIYGVIPFIAPEVLRGKPYTPTSNIYSFSMIMWEFTSGVPPFNDRAHNLQLSISICKGERPEIIENTPQCYMDLMKKCWNEDPLKRPSAEKVKNIIGDWIFRPYNNEISEELKSNIMEFINAPIGNNNIITESHPQAYYTSRLLDFTSKKVNEILESECLNYIVVEKSSEKLKETVESEFLDCLIDNTKSFVNHNIANNMIRITDYQCGASFKYITLLCLVKENTIANAFPVDIEKDQLVGHLKKVIKAEQPQSFANVDAKDIKLWKVEIGGDHLSDQLKNLKLNSDYWTENLSKNIFTS
ncbi:hypothetical protein RclHR1_04210009 [Rhizophagus clarus]|uniref:Protein kinase domain-containing protein n=2 Tax=Rhizophagus clarus TaxID=94130 RepID=A0A2Z6RKE2_9GLOM|nr:hypothetical protein RclHR1_04210009 [Rhizophagus clarus]